MLRNYLYLILMQIGIVAISTSTGVPVVDPRQAQAYFMKYGYLTPSDSSTAQDLHHGDAWTEAIRDFQTFAGLRVTGILDRRTMALMTVPRCGFADRRNRINYTFLGSKWPRKGLTYRVSKYTNKLTRQEVDDEFSSAFDVWSRETDLSFSATNGDAVDIEIRFEVGDHGDGNENAFDGPGGVLAHASSPDSGGDAHFDDTEDWTVAAGGQGIDLLRVAAHEFGHSLGLGHSQVNSALMAPFYHYDSLLRLDSDDIDGIRSLYGRKTNTGGNGGNNPPPTHAPPTTSTTSNYPPPDYPAPSTPTYAPPPRGNPEPVDIR